MDVDPTVVAALSGFVGGIVSKVADKAQERVAGAIDKALFPETPADDPALGRLIVEWRRGRVVNVLYKAEEKVRRRGGPRPVVRPDFLVPFLEAAGYAADEHLADLFAELLAAAVTSTDDEAQHPLYRRALEQLSADDAREFKRTCELLNHREQSPADLRLEPGHATHDLTLEQDRCIRHLELLGLTTSGQTGVIVGRDVCLVRNLSDFGRAFAQFVLPGAIARRPLR